MTSLALPLIIISAMMHALWNLLAKRAKTSGVILVFLFAVVETVVYLPFVIVALHQLRIGVLSWVAVGFMFGSGLLHTLYFWFLSKGYSIGDLSIVYPIARGTGPLLATIGAIFIFSERPTLIVFGGTLIICSGVIILTGDPRQLAKSDALIGVSYGFVTGLVVASYTLWDAYAMSRVLIAPLMFQAGLSVIRMVILFPFVLHRAEEIRHAWRIDHWNIIGIAIMSSLAYLIILFVLAFAPVSYVAPMRTLSILIGVLLGTNLLKEKDMPRRVLASLAIIVGVVMLNIG